MSTRRGWLRVLGVVVVAGLLGSSGDSQGVRFGHNRISISATPRRVPADGKSLSRIRVDVRALDEQPVADGTEVIISTDIGDLVGERGSRQRILSMPTQSGYAIVLLSSKEPGTATVRAVFQDSRNQILIEFTEEGPIQSRVVHVRGGWVGYCADLNLLQAREPGEVKYCGLTVEADRIEVDPRTLVLKAYNAVRLRRNEAELECEDLYVELTSMRGTCRRWGDLGVEEFSFNAFTLEPVDTDMDLPEGAYRFDEREGQTWMVARSVAVFPGEKVVLRNAKLYVGNRKIMRFPPYWVIGFEGYRGATNSNFLEVDSTYGVALDFPFFLSVTDTMSHAVKIRKGATAGSIMARDAWHVNYEFTYSQPRHEGEGVLTIDGLPLPDWGIQLQETRKMFGDADTSLSIAWPDRRNVFSDFSLFRYGKAGHLSFRTHADRYADLYEWAYGADADFLSTPTPWSDWLDFRWGTGVRADRNPWYDEGLVFEHQMSTYLDFASWRPSGSLSITPSINDTYSWDTQSRRSNIARLQLTLNQRIAQGINANVRYGLEHRTGTDRYYTLTSSDGINQQVSLNLSAFASRRWDLFANANYSITDDSLYLLGSMNYRPMPKWRLGAVGSLYEFSSVSFHDVELSLNRAIGNREVGVRWSRVDDQLSLVFGSAGF